MKKLNLKKNIFENLKLIKTKKQKSYRKYSKTCFYIQMKAME